MNRYYARLQLARIAARAWRRRRSAAAVVPPTKPGWLIGAVPCKLGAPVTGIVLAQGTHQTGCEIAWMRSWLAVISPLALQAMMGCLMIRGHAQELVDASIIINY